MKVDCNLSTIPLPKNEPVAGEFGSVTVLSINWCYSTTSLNKSGVRPCILQKPGFLTEKNPVSAPVL
ncbi:hypothetical protein [Microcoleus sp. S28C3]|uniref:hypothetical protein n=1 Tax=Microcoleus sp. S28C3 TaxID=3055414 RepID=UPI002FD73E93